MRDLTQKRSSSSIEQVEFVWRVESEWTNERPNDKKLVGTEEDIIKFKFRGHGGEDYILLSVLIN